MLLLELNHATVLKGGRAILNDLSLAIPVGRHTAILGPNGSGKSSLIRLITRDFYPLSSPNGEPAIRILGQGRWEVSSLRSQLGIVTNDLEQALLEEKRTGVEVVLSGFFASHGVYKHHKITDEMQDRVNHALQLLEAAHLGNKPVNTMSTGEVRRILIARALVPNPLALLLDEPSAGLDLAARLRFLERLRLIAQQGKTIVMVTHHVEEILPEIEHVILLKDGHLFRDGVKSECLTSEVMSCLLDANVEIEKKGDYYWAHTYK